MSDASRTRGLGPTWVMEQPAGGEFLLQKKIRLVVTLGPDQGREVVMESERLLMGTCPENDLTLSDPTVSRQHAELRFTQRGLVLQDLGSTNGTVVNDLLVDEVRLPSAVEICLGNTRIQITALDDTVTHQLAPADRFGGVLGRTPIMRALFTKLSRAAASDLTVLLEGESGTGKELVARALHENSPRNKGPFIVVDCGALPRGLIESELYGHEAGAFTGATHGRQGAFEQAQGGTLFLDEIGELDLDLQPRLLRALESREIKRLGGTRMKHVDIRVVAGTNRQLERCVSEGSFREDLFYRLAVVHFDLPPLRERRDDVPLLVQHFLDDFARSSGRQVQISPQEVQQLVDRSWPGNVRQLRNAVERFAVMSTIGTQAGGELRAEEPRGSMLLTGASGHATLEETITAYASEPNPYKVARSRLLDLFERAYLTGLIARNENNMTHSARAAQIDRVYLLRLLDKHDLRKPRSK